MTYRVSPKSRIMQFFELRMNKNCLVRDFGAILCIKNLIFSVSVSSDESPEKTRSSRSLKLRSLASFSSAEKSNKPSRQLFKCRKSPRLAEKQISEGPSTDEDQGVGASTDDVDVENDTIVVESDNDETEEIELADKAHVSISDADVSVPVHSSSSGKDVDVWVTSGCDEIVSCDETFYSCADQTSESLYEVAEMAHVSIHVDMDDVSADSDDVTIDSSQDTTDFPKSKSQIKRNRGKNTLDMSVDSTTAATEDRTDDDSVSYVEMAEMSVMPDPIMISNNSELSLSASGSALEVSKNNQSINEHVEIVEMSTNPVPHQECDDVISENDIATEDRTDDDAVSYVEMAEMSVMPDPIMISDNSELSLSAFGSTLDVGRNNQSVNEHVEMVEMSTNPVPHQECDDVISENDIASESLVSDANETIAKPMNSAFINENSSIAPSDCDQNVYGFVEMNEVSVNPDPLAPSIEQTDEGDITGDSNLKPLHRKSSHVSAHSVNLVDSKCSKNFECYVTLVDGLPEKSTSKIIPNIGKKSEKKLKVLTDDSFNTFVRDLEVEPLNSSFENTEVDANKDSRSCAENNEDIVEDSEQYRKKLLKTKSIEKHQDKFADTKKISTPRRGRKTKKVYYTRKKKNNAEPNSISKEEECGPSQNPPVPEETTNSPPKCANLSPNVSQPTLNIGADNALADTTGNLTAVSEEEVNDEEASSETHDDDVIVLTNTIESPQASGKVTELNMY